METAMQGSPSQQGQRVLLAGTRVFMGAVFLGYLVVWILSPTNLWRKNWGLKVYKHSNPTYFGQQGSTLLIFTFPILLIAVLGCLYLHLGRKKSGNYMERNGENSRLAFWKRPLLVKGPLGVVSAIELAFLAMFIALLIWTLSTKLTIRFSETNRGIYHHHNDGHDHDKRWQLKLRTSAYNLGLVGNICCAFLFFPITRGSSILPLVGLTSEASIKYHVWVGHLAMILFTAHGAFYSLYWGITHDLVQLLKWDKVGVSNVAGEIALVFGIVMWITVLPRIRRRKFELFFYTHQLYLMFLLFYVLHVGIAFFAQILPGVYLFLIDRYLRFLQSRQKVRLVSARLLPCETLELNFTKSPGLVYTPTSVMFVNVPSISSLQWHPLTISSNYNLEPDNLSVIIKKEGSWSQKLYKMLSLPLDRLDVSVEGPYGPAAVNFLRHDTLVLVSGGSGITPFISIIREFISISTTLSSPTPRIFLISAFKTSSDLTMLDFLLPISPTHSPISHLHFQLEAFVTREKEPPTSTHSHKLIQTIWFKPLPSDAPISPVLGRNSWLWLGAIISSSFVMFLVLVGFLTRYYIYPIDHNTNEIYSTSFKALLNTLFICFCIALAASVATLWNKKSLEGNQTPDVEMATSMTTSPSSWLWGFVERELESLPDLSLGQSCKVHYGARPPLKRCVWEEKALNLGCCWRLKAPVLGFWLVGQKKCAMMLLLFALLDRRIIYISRPSALTGDSSPFVGGGVGVSDGGAWFRGDGSTIFVQANN